eukprot:1180140-Prorocentrum_minimum.AAC.15
MACCTVHEAQTSKTLVINVANTQDSQERAPCANIYWFPGLTSRGVTSGGGSLYLLAHGGLVRVAGGLVVIREGDDGAADAEDHGRVDLAVRVRGVEGAARLHALARHRQVRHGHGDHRRLLLLRVHVLDQPLRHQVVPPKVRCLVVLHTRAHTHTIYIKNM